MEIFVENHPIIFAVIVMLWLPAGYRAAEINYDLCYASKQIGTSGFGTAIAILGGPFSLIASIAKVFYEIISFFLDYHARFLEES